MVADVCSKLEADQTSLGEERLLRAEDAFKRVNM